MNNPSVEFKFCAYLRRRRITYGSPRMLPTLNSEEEEEEGLETTLFSLTSNLLGGVNVKFSQKAGEGEVLMGLQNTRTDTSLQ